MNLHQLVETLSKTSTLHFKTINGQFIPPHFHLTEIAGVEKKFIDCGGTFRSEQKVTLQLWFDAADLEHRLTAEKFIKIIELGIQQIGLNPDVEVHVEYQGNTIETYGLAFDGVAFLLVPQQTACLAPDKCAPKQKIQLVELGKTEGATCTPGSGCC